MSIVVTPLSIDNPDADIGASVIADVAGGETMIYETPTDDGELRRIREIGVTTDRPIVVFLRRKDAQGMQLRRVGVGQGGTILWRMAPEEPCIATRGSPLQLCVDSKEHTDVTQITAHVYWDAVARPALVEEATRALRELEAGAVVECTAVESNHHAEPFIGRPPEPVRAR